MLDEFSFGLVTAGLLLGLRHGIDWDHIAAISDLTSSQQKRLRGIVMGTLYAFGHAAVVIVLGLIAILFGTVLPEWLDRYLEIIVGLTLLLLGTWLIWNMVRHKGRVILRSRWMLIFEFLRNVHNKILKKPTNTNQQHREYSAQASVSIGAVHGIGAETGTQAILLTATVGATSALAGSFLLIAFVVGLLLSNTLITIAASSGLLGGDHHSKLHLILGIFVAGFSLILGFIFVMGKTQNLPSFFA
ncbi:MAG: hypothetical protein CL783_07310 [Chloroflexi bacterium]|nr:hypothetical protein [Chloroflexota bacterium]